MLQCKGRTACGTYFSWTVSRMDDGEVDKEKAKTGIKSRLMREYGTLDGIEILEGLDLFN